MRNYSSRISGDGGSPVSYDAFARDVAVVNFFFESPNAVLYSKLPRMNWVDFVSQVGGLLGLGLGFSMVSLVELLYWTTVVMSRNCRRNNEVDEEDDIDNAEAATITASATTSTRTSTAKSLVVDVGKGKEQEPTKVHV